MILRYDESHARGVAQWRLIDVMAPLLAPDGHPYEVTALPCTARPEWWDDDARPADQRVAATLCRHDCPAIHECNLRRLDLGKPSGVWAGKIYRAKTREPDREEVHAEV